MSLLLNFSPIQFDDAKVEAGLFAYGADGEKALKELRRKHWVTHVFRREGPDQIVAISTVENALRLGTGSKSIRLKDNLGLTASLIRNSLLNTLAGIGRDVLNYDPIRFVARDDVLRDCLPQGATCPDWLGVKLLYEVAIRPIYFFKHEPFIAAVLDMRTTRIIDRNVGDLIADGFSPVGCYVTTRSQANPDPRISPKPELAGRVISVSGDTLNLADSRDGITSIPAQNVWLEKRAFPAVLAHVFRGREATIGANLEKARADLRQGPARLQRITKIVEFLAAKPHTACGGVSFKFLPLLDTPPACFPR